MLLRIRKGVECSRNIVTILSSKSKMRTTQYLDVPGERIHLIHNKL